MSARAVLQGAVTAWLEAAGLAVFDAPPARAALPYVTVDEPQLAAADAAGVRGRVGTIALFYTDAGERPVRLRGLVAAAEAALEALPPDVGEGWRVAGLRLARSRIARGKGDAWTAMSEFAVRLFQADA